ncbi:LysR family transcriptional regulator [Longispora albida]|uniref:LysR family transcriptional regulator n=1 Tax=Longispora albida TaxID=203523 RepID=UPI0003771B5D|nr:LysR family transcriptional regulator [Longispora albida]
MLDVRRLHLLRDLARLGTIAAVAGMHRYTPSAVSQQLATLEREAGTPLLERTGRRVTLTPAGRVLAEHAEAVLAALEEAGSAVAAVARGLSGPLRIGAYPTAVRALLPATLAALGRRHPGLELRVDELDPALVPAALRERRLDVGLLHDYDAVPVRPDPALDTTPLLDETVYLAVPAADGPPPGEDPVRASRDRPWILGSPGTLCHTVAVELGRRAGYAPRARHHADDFATVVALVAAGLGVAIVPELAIEHPPAGARLLPLPTRRRTRIAYRKGAADHPAVAAFTAEIRTAVAARPAPLH